MANPRATALALITHRGRVLLLLMEEDGYTYWAPPGGGLRSGETLPEAAAREAKEETGLSVRIDALQYVHDFINREDGCHKVEVYFRAHPVGDPTPRRSAACDARIRDARWFTWDEVRTLTTFPLELAAMLPEDLGSDTPSPARYF